MRRASLKPRSCEQARAGIIILVLVSFLVGLVVSALYFRKAPGHSRAEGTEGQPFETLSDSTKAVLKGLKSPVEVRFYLLLDPATAGDALQAFAKRADQLLAEYKREAGGRINLVRYDSLSDASAGAAFADGMKPFSMDKGEACYLGITVSQDGQKESLPRLDSDWEPALESDLTRAIVRVSNKAPTTTPVAPVTSQPDKDVVDEVKRAIPNLASVSLEDGTQILRAEALKEFANVANQMEAQIKEAQQRLAEAQNSKSEAAQQAAMKDLQQVQAEQADKIKQIAAQLQAKVTALEYLKQN